MKKVGFVLRYIPCKGIVQVMDYLAVFLHMKRAPVKIVVRSEAFEHATCSEADNLVCVQPSPSKDSEALQKLS